MITYRIEKIDKDEMLLKFESHAFDDAGISDEIIEEDVILPVDKRCFEGDWVALDGDKLIHIDETKTKDIIKNMDEAMIEFSKNPQSFPKFSSARFRYELMMSNPPLVKDEDEYFKQRNDR